MDTREIYLVNAEIRLIQHKAEIEQIKAGAKLPKAHGDNDVAQGLQNEKEQLHEVKEPGGETFAELKQY